MKNLAILVLVLTLMKSQFVHGTEISNGPRCQREAEEKCGKERNLEKYIACCQDSMKWCLLFIHVRSDDSMECEWRSTKFTFCYSENECTDIYMEENVCMIF
eukprot:TCONS_00050185-protein